jgi:hypothetical protein
MLSEQAGNRLDVGALAKADEANRADLVGSQGGILGTEGQDGGLHLGRAGPPPSARLGDEEAGEAFGVKEGGSARDGALGDAGLVRPLGGRVPKEDDGADELVGTLLGPAERLL